MRKRYGLLFLFVVLSLTVGCDQESGIKVSDDIFAAIEKSDHERVKAILSHAPKFKAQCGELTYAVRKGEEKIVSYLLETKPNTECTVRKTSGDTPLIVSLIGGHQAITKMLVEYGADVNYPNSWGATPFWGLVSMGNIEMIGYFLEHGAVVNQKGNFPDPLGEANAVVMDITPLMMVSLQGDVDVVNLLVKYGGNVNQKDSLGRRAIDYARKDKHDNIIKILEKYETNK